MNFNIKVKSENISDHRKLKDLNLNINYENQLLNFNQSNLVLEDILEISLIESKFVNSKKQYFSGTFEILIYDHSKLYRFFQTKKKYRKKIDSIYITTKYDFIKNDLILEKVIIDNNTSKNINYLIKQYNQDNKPIRNKVDLRNFFNSFIEEL